MRLLIPAGSLLWIVAVAQAQTVSEVAKLPEPQQREIILRIANTAAANFLLRTEQDGKAKSEEDYTRDRSIANLVRALFILDPQNPNTTGEGMRVTLIRIRKYSTQTPDQTVIGVMSELVEWSYKHFYADFYTADKKAEFAKKTDAEQEALFRVYIGMYENQKLYERVTKEMKDRDDQLAKEMREMYDNAIILADGRHVLRTNNGHFMVIPADPNDKSVELEERYNSEARSLYDCMKARGIKTGREARGACVQ